MDKLAMCRICLANDIPMRLIENKCLHEMYEMLTKLPFVTEDCRPMLVCYICCARLQNSYKLAKSCRRSEELFQQMLSSDAVTPNKLDQLPCTKGYITKLVAHMSCPSVSDGTYLHLSRETNDCKEEQTALDRQMDNSVEVKLEPIEESMPDADNNDVSHTDPLTSCTLKAEPDSDVSDNETDVFDEQQAHGRVTESQSSEDNSFDNQNELLVERSYKKETINKDNNDACELKLDVKPDIVSCSQNLLYQTSQIPYKCNICSESFSQMSLLVKHNREHTGRKRFACVVCSKCFAKKSDLDKHITIHTGEKPHQCNICDRYFSRKDNLATHIRRHAGDKPFKCDVCEKCFTVKSSLVEHNRIHTGEKPYKCKYCYKCFTKQTDLVRHHRIHTGDKPYKCDVCDKRFSVKGKLVKHNRVHTKKSNQLVTTT